MFHTTVVQERTRAAAPRKPSVGQPALQTALLSREGREVSPALALPEDQATGSIKFQQKLCCGPVGKESAWNGAKMKETCKTDCDSCRVRDSGPVCGGRGSAQVRGWRPSDSAPGSPVPSPQSRGPAHSQPRTCVGLQRPQARVAPSRPWLSWKVGMCSCPALLQVRGS